MDLRFENGMAKFEYGVGKLLGMIVGFDVVFVKDGSFAGKRSWLALMVLGGAPIG